MKSRKIARLLVAIFLVLGLALLALLLPRKLHSGSFVRIQIPHCSGKFLIDKVEYPLAQNTSIFLTPGKHELLVTLTWYVPLRQKFETKGTFLPFGEELSLSPSFQSIDPTSLMELSLFDFGLGNPPNAPAINPATRPEELAMAAEALTHGAGYQRPAISANQNTWLACSWFLGHTSQARTQVLLAASALAGNGGVSPFGPTLLISAIATTAINSQVFFEPGQLEPPVTQGEWASFLTANPQWGPRQRPVLRSRGLVDQHYLQSFEANIEAAKVTKDQTWKRQSIREVSLSAVEAYIAWRMRGQNGLYRLPTVAELQSVYWKQRLNSEWTATNWPQSVTRIAGLAAWKVPFQIVIETSAAGKDCQLGLYRGSTASGLGFRLVRVAKNQ